MKIKKIIILIMIVLVFTILISTFFILRNNTKELKDIKELQVSGFEIQDNIIINGTDKEIIIEILEKLNYNRKICAGINKYTIKLDNGIVYGIKEECKEILKGDKQAEISDEDLNIILNIIDKNKKNSNIG